MDVDGLHRQLDMEDSHLYMVYTPLTQWDARPRTQQSMVPMSAVLNKQE